MKPKNKFQQYLVEIDKSLPQITEKQKTYAVDKVLKHEAVRLKSGKITCLDCGYSWKSSFKNECMDTITEDVCPNCKTKVGVKTERKKIFNNKGYFGILTTHKNIQVIRTFEVLGYYKSGTVPRRFAFERSRVYITDKGKYGVIGNSYQHSWSGDKWVGSFSLKENKTITSHSIIADVYYPIKKVLPIIKRNGFTGNAYSMSYFDLFYAILTNQKAETLLKSNQVYLLIEFSIYKENKIANYWNEIKICIRNNYIVEEPSDWFNYLDLLKDFGKDTLNRKYVCPADFHKEHQRYVEKKCKIRLIKKMFEQRNKLKEDQRIYEIEKKDFFNLEFTNEQLVIKVMSNVKEIMEVGDKLHHCIYANEYYKIKDSLLMCALINGEAIETIEFGLKNFKVLQSRGLQNQFSAYHEDIINLVNNNVKLIKQRSIHKTTA